MSALWAMIRRVTVGDLAILLAALALIAALLRPTLHARDVRRRIASAIADVDTVSAVARRSRDAQGAWPTVTLPGEVPPQLAALAVPGGPLSRPDHGISWTTWEVVDSVEAPEEAPPTAPGDAPRTPARPRMVPAPRAVGAVAVHTRDEMLLAGLLQHYGSDASFVLDTLWILLLPERQGASPPIR